MKHVQQYPLLESELLNPDLLRAQDPDRTADELAELSLNPKWRVRLAVVQHPNVSVETIADVYSREKDLDVLWGIAGNDKTPARILDRISHSYEKTVRQVVASNPNASPETLTRLAGDESNWVRKRVARNPSSPGEALLGLAEDPDGAVRLALAENSKIPLAAIRKLANDSSSSVVLVLIDNRSVPAEVLVELMSRTEDPRLRLEIQEHPNWPTDLDQWALNLDDW